MSEDNPAAPTPEEAAGRPTFDQAALARMRTAGLDILLDHPEVRSVSVVLDFAEGLNDAPSLQRGIWFGTDGRAVNHLPAVLGSVRNTLAMLEVMMQRAAAINQNLRSEAAALGKTIIERRTELERLTAQTAAAQPPAGQHRGIVEAWPGKVCVKDNGDVCTIGSDNDADQVLAAFRDVASAVNFLIVQGYHPAGYNTADTCPVWER